MFWAQKWQFLTLFCLHNMKLFAGEVECRKKNWTNSGNQVDCSKWFLAKKKQLSFNECLGPWWLLLKGASSTNVDHCAGQLNQPQYSMVIKWTARLCWDWLSCLERQRGNQMAATLVKMIVNCFCDLCVKSRHCFSVNSYYFQSLWRYVKVKRDAQQLVGRIPGRMTINVMT